MLLQTAYLRHTMFVRIISRLCVNNKWQFDDWLTDEDSKATGRQSTVSQEHIKAIHAVRRATKYSDTHSFISCDRSAGYILEHSHDLTSKHSYKRVQKLRLAIVIIMLLCGWHCWQNVVITGHNTAAINAAGDIHDSVGIAASTVTRKKVILPSTLSFLNFLMDWQRTASYTPPQSPYALKAECLPYASLRAVPTLCSKEFGALLHSQNKHRLLP